jgi:hypothetical protein
MTLSKSLHCFVYLFFLLASCAKQSSPTGGPKDTIPPVLVRAQPPNETINFRGNKVQLIFSEDIILNAPKEQLIVTPTIGKDYKIAAKRNTVILEFEEPLQDSTTYTFNFREAVQDITEKNPVENLAVAYSTGQYIDSLSIEGTVFDMLKGKEVADATVALHVENDTFSIFEHPAIYFTKTDKEGTFRIDHLKPDNYFIYAFQDKNRNLIVNSRSEAYGFLSEHQYLLENIEGLSIGMMSLDAGPLKITSGRPYNTYFNIKTSKNLRTFKLVDPDSSDLSFTFGEDKANIRLYDTTDKDSLQIHLTATDSINQVIDTTLYAKFLTREVTPEKFATDVVSASVIADKGHIQALVRFSKPLGSLNFDSIYYQIDSLTRVNFLPEDVKWEPLTRELKISKRTTPSLFANGQTNGQARRGGRPPAAAEEPTNGLKKSYELHLRSTAFISIEGDTSETSVQEVKPLGEQDLSIINIGIQTNEPSFIVQLVNKEFKVIQEVANKNAVKFVDVIPGDYQVRLIIDRNENGRWDPGNYYEKTEPEPVIYYRGLDGTTTIKGVKANWEVGSDNEMLITY